MRDIAPVPPRWLVMLSRVLRFRFGVVHMHGALWWVVAWSRGPLLKIWAYR